jgi:RNA polymerase sigma-70 factor (ECF subfamily)
MTDRAATESVTQATVRLAAAGNEAAFASLVAEHYAAMSRVAYVILGDADDTADAVQAAWAKAWRRLHSVRDETRIRPWLLAVTANEARDALRRQRRSRALPLTFDLEGPSGDDPEGAINLVDLERVLRGLKPDERALLSLRYAGGLDSGEIAAQLGMSASGVRTRLFRLVQRLRTDLADE